MAAHPLRRTGNGLHADVDPITAEIIRHALTAIPGQIDANIVRTAYSPLIYEYKDYAVGVVDHAGRLLSQSPGALPIFVANALGVAVRDGLSIYGPEGFAAGDVVISNHAGTLGQHLNNVVMYAPIFADDQAGDLFGFMAVLVHWLDVGGGIVGSMSPFATEIFHEGIQYRSVKLYDAGRPNIGVLKTIEANTRFPRELMGDVEAQLAGCLRGVELVSGILEKYGVGTARSAVDQMWDRSEQAARAAVIGIPDGIYRARSLLDDDGVDAGKPVPIEVAVHVEGDRMVIDFAGTAAEVRGAINSGREGGAVAAARIAFKYLVQPDEPANEGAFRPLEIRIEDGTFISAGPTAAMGNYSTPLATVVDTILKAVAQAIPERVAAGHHGAFGVHVFSGIHPSTGELYQHLESVIGGWGATARADGVGPFKTLVHGDTLDVPVEAQEALYSLRIERYGFIPGSGGDGQYRGGLGLEKRYRLLADTDLTVVQEREATPPWGLCGGMPGSVPRTTLHRAGEPDRDVRKATLKLRAGDHVTIRSGGGGGYGDPARRDAEALRRDRQQGFLGPGAEVATRDRQANERLASEAIDREN